MTWWWDGKNQWKESPEKTQDLGKVESAWQFQNTWNSLTAWKSCWEIPRWGLGTITQLYLILLGVTYLSPCCWYLGTQWWRGYVPEQITMAADCNLHWLPPVTVHIKDCNNTYWKLLSLSTQRSNEQCNAKDCTATANAKTEYYIPNKFNVYYFENTKLLWHNQMKRKINNTHTYTHTQKNSNK